MKAKQIKTLLCLSSFLVLFGGGWGGSRYATLLAGESDRVYVTTQPLTSTGKTPLKYIPYLPKESAKKPSHGFTINNPALQNHPYQEPEKSKVAPALPESVQQSLKQLRAAVEKFHADKNRFPRSLDELIHGQYISELPTIPIPGFHSTSNRVAANGIVDDAGGWYYNPATGHVGINCTHNANNGL